MFPNQMRALVLALWENPGFGGKKRLFVEDARELGSTTFNDKTSAVGVHPGPDYTAYKNTFGREPRVGLFEHTDFRGASLVLTAGTWPDIGRLFNFNDIVSSIFFDPPPNSAHTIAPIPLIVELFEHTNFTGRKLVVVENSSDVRVDFGDEYNDVVSSVRVRQGPNFVAGNQARLFRDPNFQGGGITLAPGNHTNIGASHGFNDVVTSIIVR